MKKSKEKQYEEQSQKPKKTQLMGQVIVIVIIVGAWYYFLGRQLLPEHFLWPNKQSKEVGTSYYEGPCTQANVAKILACTLGEDEAKREEQELWYSKYYERLNQMGFTALEEENALDQVSYELLINILNEVLGNHYHISLEDSELDLSKNISFNQFISNYIKILNELGKEEALQVKTLAILATPADSAELEAWQVLTDAGLYNFEGLVLDPLKSKTVTAVVEGSHILGIKEISSETSYLSDCIVASVNGGIITVQLGEQKLSYKSSILGLEAIGSSYHLTIKDDEIVDAQIAVAHDVDIFLRADDKTATFQKAGTVNYSTLTIRDESGKYQSISELPCGTQVRCTITDQNLTTVEVVNTGEANNIRVLLSNAGHYELHNVYLVSAEDYIIDYNGTQETLKKEQGWKANEFAWQEGQNTIRFIPITDSSMKILNMTKGGNHPKYKGIIEVNKVGNQYYIINDVDMEDYVAAVIPSEMPTSYGLEAAKVQAVAARTYAVNSRSSSKFASYGAQLDDTTSSQVYNNIAANDTSYEAARATKGQILEVDNSSFSSKFFATSCGYTANFAEVWSPDDSFEGKTPDYLSSNRQYLNDVGITDLTNEEQASKFFHMTGEELDALDQDSPWFRWEATLTSDALNSLINSNITGLSEAYPNLIKVKGDGKEWVSQTIESLGNIKSLEVLERGEGGNIMTLKIEGSLATAKVSTEYVIRSLFATTSEATVTITRSNESTVSGMSLLPSAFFVMEPTYNEDQSLKTLEIHGGGFGHGVGMSQDGVLGMTEKGYDYASIIAHYYPGTDLVNLLG